MAMVTLVQKMVMVLPQCVTLKHVLVKYQWKWLQILTRTLLNLHQTLMKQKKNHQYFHQEYPNLLVNGTSGIAVGMATNIPPHNLTETINAIVKIIDNKVEENRDTTIEEIMEIIKGPDFPTGATILGRKDIEQAYRTGRGKIKTRAVSEIETMDNGKSRIIVTELPYMVNKAKLVEKIASLVKEKKVDGITDLRDESDQGRNTCCN